MNQKHYVWSGTLLRIWASSTCSSSEFRSRTPAHDVNLLGLIPSDNRTPVDIKEIIARVVDGSKFHEFKSRYGTTLVCGFAHIHGHKVGIVANNGILFSESSLKGATL